MTLGSAIGRLIVIAAVLLLGYPHAGGVESFLTKVPQTAILASGRQSGPAGVQTAFEVHIPHGLYAGYTIKVLPEVFAATPFESAIPLPIVRPVFAWQEYPVALCVDTMAKGQVHSHGIGLTTAVEQVTREMNEIVGEEVFLLPTICPSGADRSFPGVVIQVVGSTTPATPEPFALTHVSTECRAPTVYEVGCELAEIRHAVIQLRADDATTLQDYTSGGVLHHELLHALGLSHSCVAPTILFTDFDEEVLTRCRQRAAQLGYPPLRQTPRPSPYDLAHLFVIQLLKEELLAKDAPSGTSQAR